MDEPSLLPQWVGTAVVLAGLAAVAVAGVVAGAPVLVLAAAGVLVVLALRRTG